MSEGASRRRRLTLEEYLALEEASPVRHEYVAGEIHALSGVTLRHNLIAANILVHLTTAARGGRCRVYMSDVKVRAGDSIYYPDVMVECAGGDLADLIVESPCLIVEVSSRTTVTVDRREKLVAYSSLPTLQAYLIVEQDRRRVTRHWRDAEGAWGSVVISDHGDVPVPCPETVLTLDAIYENVAMPPLGVAERPENVLQE